MRAFLNTTYRAGRRGNRGNNRGVALLITLTIIAVLVAVSVELHKRKRAAVMASAAARDRITLIPMAEAGVHAAMAMLVQDRIDSEIDSVQEDWANPEKINKVLADIPFDEGKLEVVIRDERGRIQVNALITLPGHEFNPEQFHLWDRLLGFLKQADESLSEVDHNAIINSIKDWIDDGDDDARTGLTGAETPYYEALDPPYKARNAPMDHLGDLARIKGVTQELLESAQGQVDFRSYLSVYGVSDAEGGDGYTYDGKININTAPLPVLAALLPDDYEGYAPAIFDHRIEKSDDQFINALNGLDWYKNVPGLEDLSLKPAVITNTSDIFRIASTATLNGRSQTVEAVVERVQAKKSKKWRCRIMRWQMK